MKYALYLLVLAAALSQARSMHAAEDDETDVLFQMYQDVQMLKAGMIDAGTRFRAIEKELRDVDRRFEHQREEMLMHVENLVRRIGEVENELAFPSRRRR